MPLNRLDFRTCADRGNGFTSDPGADRYFAHDVAQPFDRIGLRLQPHAGANPRNPDAGCSVPATHQGRQSQPAPVRRTGRARRGRSSASAKVEVSIARSMHTCAACPPKMAGLAQAAQFSATRAESRSRVRHDRRGSRPPTRARLASACSFRCMLTTIDAGIYTKTLSATFHFVRDRYTPFAFSREFAGIDRIRVGGGTSCRVENRP